MITSLHGRTVHRTGGGRFTSISSDSRQSVQVIRHVGLVFAASYEHQQWTIMQYIRSEPKVSFTILHRHEHDLVSVILCHV